MMDKVEIHTLTEGIGQRSGIRPEFFQSDSPSPVANRLKDSTWVASKRQMFVNNSGAMSWQPLQQSI